MVGPLDLLVAQLAQQLLQKQQRLAVAESCTGGWLAKQCTDLPGSSAWFECGFVTYSNQSKVSMLGVSQDTLVNFGAVSEPVVAEMAAGVLQRSAAQWAISISGVAGPGGGSPDKPVGTVCFGWANKDGAAQTTTVLFYGGRKIIRKQSVVYILKKILEETL
ncbi:MAG: nicotinamide-nucleotide amidohydrolase family protein [Gammaproteobacteria bacterium]